MGRGGKETSERWMESDGIVNAECHSAEGARGRVDCNALLSLLSLTKIRVRLTSEKSGSVIGLAPLVFVLGLGRDRQTPTTPRQVARGPGNKKLDSEIIP